MSNKTVPPLRRILALHNIPASRFIAHNQQRRHVLSKAVAKRVQVLKERHDDIVQQLNTGTGDNVAALGKEMSSLAQVASLATRISSLQEESTSLQELLEEATLQNDQDMMQECQAELKKIEVTLVSVQQKIIHAILPRDSDDYSSNAILEIRAGTGGEEAALFTGELLTAYHAAAKHKGWNFEYLNSTQTDLGGIKEAAVSISSKSSSSYINYTQDDDDHDILAGLGPFGYFRFESGVHRVQRVPVNDVKIQTSACSVAVLPSPSDDNEEQSLLPTSDLKIETMRASGAGGQHVNTTESAVRITHLPTGITAAIQDERSQHKNKQKALKLIAARVRDALREEEARQRGDARNSLMGSGDRSERIRTYNFPQDRVTDHRCKHSEHGIATLLNVGNHEGLVDRFAPPMRRMHREELIQQLDTTNENE